MGPSSYFVDGVSSIALHNGVYRITFVRLDKDARPVNEVELLVPQSQFRELLAGLQKASR